VRRSGFRHSHQASQIRFGAQPHTVSEKNYTHYRHKRDKPEENFRKNLLLVLTLKGVEQDTIQFFKCMFDLLMFKTGPLNRASSNNPEKYLLDKWNKFLINLTLCTFKSI